MDIFWLPKFWNFLDILTILVVSWKMISEIRAVLKKLSHLLPLAISQIANYTSISSHSSLRPLINQWMGGEWGFLFVYVSLLFSYSSPLIVGPESFVSQPYSTIASIYKRLEWESITEISCTLFPTAGFGVKISLCCCWRKRQTTYAAASWISRILVNLTITFSFALKIWLTIVSFSCSDF